MALNAQSYTQSSPRPIGRRRLYFKPIVATCEPSLGFLLVRRHVSSRLAPALLSASNAWSHSVNLWTGCTTIKHTQTHTHTHTRIHTHTHTHTNMSLLACSAHTHGCSCTPVHTGVGMRSLSRTHTRSNTSKSTFNLTHFKVGNNEEREGENGRMKLKRRKQSRENECQEKARY